MQFSLLMRKTLRYVFASAKISLSRTKSMEFIL